MPPLLPISGELRLELDIDKPEKLKGLALVLITGDEAVFGPLRLRMLLALSGHPRDEKAASEVGCCWEPLLLFDDRLQLLLLLLLAPSDDEVEVDCDDCDEPKISENDTFSSIGDGSPLLMISLCSSSSEFIECFWSISGPVSDRAISGLGQSLKLVCCSEGISPMRYSVSFAAFMWNFTS